MIKKYKIIPWPNNLNINIDKIKSTLFKIDNPYNNEKIVLFETDDGEILDKLMNDYNLKMDNYRSLFSTTGKSENFYSIRIELIKKYKQKLRDEKIKSLIDG